METIKSMASIARYAERDTMPDEIQTTAGEEYSHDLEEGDELTDTAYDTPVTVTDVDEDGDVTFRAWLDERHGEEYWTETFGESVMAAALTDLIMVPADE